MWDNVGLLLEPSGASKIVRRVMLTNDLTEEVMEECVAGESDLIFSYHPPIFAPFKRLTAKNWKDRIVTSCLENKIALYSPHTVFDNMEGGVADWLVQPFGAGPVSVIHQGLDPKHAGGHSHNVTVSGIRTIESGDSSEILAGILSLAGVTVRFSDSDSSVSVDCPESKLAEVVEALAQLSPSSSSSSSGEIRVVRLEKLPVRGQGQGRMKTLDKAMTLRDVVEETKRHCSIKNLRLAVAKGKDMDSQVRTIAVCPGSGRSVLANCPADVWISGEMSHHEVLDAVHAGSSVILCEHSNSERGFLRDVRLQLVKLLGDGGVEIAISERDRDPLLIV